MQSPLAAASPIGATLVPLWGGVAPAMGLSRGYGVTLSLLWGRAMAMGWRSPCNDAVLPLGDSAVPILPYPCNDAVLPLGGSVVPILPYPCNDAVLPLGGSAVPSLQ